MNEPNYNEYHDPRLVEIYDTVCALGEEKQLFVDIIKKLSVNKIIDLGCGTGLLTCELAKLGYQMIGVEPSKLMLQQARKSSCGSKVEWIRGDGLSLENHNADLVIMTGHVSQFLLEDDYWSQVLNKIHDSLQPGGYLLFETRNPDVQPWTKKTQTENVDWFAPDFRKTVTDPQKGKIEVWLDEPQVEGNRATYGIHYLFIETGEELVSTNTLIFRTREELEESLQKAGFSVETVYGDWDGSKATPDSPEFIFVAKKV
jgi:SAM-dependent methyltransferase